MRTAAVLDLGTNTFKLGLYQLHPENTFDRLKEEERFVKLGLKKIGEITPDAWERGIKALRIYREEIDAAKAEIVLAAGTEALRKADNGQVFLDAVKSTLDLEIQIISGAEEARLTLLGAQTALADWEHYVLMDIGGGSTEVALVPGNQMHSFPLGAAALFNAIQPADPFSADDIGQIIQRVRAEMGPWLNKQLKNEDYLLAGTSGSFESVAEMLYYPLTFEHLPSDKLFLEVNAKEVHDLQRTLVASSQEERLNWPGLHPERADYIVPAITLIDWMMQKLKAPTLRVIKYGLKEGLLLDWLSGT